MAAARLRSPSGATVSVDKSKVDELKRRGFTDEGSSDKTAAKKSTSSKSSK